MKCRSTWPLTRFHELFQLMVLVLLAGGSWGCTFSGGIGEEASLVSGVSLGSFSIQGIQRHSSHADDTLADAYLNFGADPLVSFGASTNATSYIVQILDSTGSTVLCTQTETSPNYIPNACALVAGTYYKAKVVAKVGSTTLVAQNSPYSFRYNRAPTLAGDTITVNYDDGAIVFDPRSNDSDADGDSLTITATTNPSFGTVGFTSTSLTYTPDGTNYGATSFTYTVSDGHGLTSTATVSVKAMTPYTWTGLGAGAPKLWSTAANWCGTVSSPGLSGVCAGAASAPNNKNTSSHIAVFNSLCTNCDVTFNAATQAYGVKIAASYTGTITQAAGGAVTLDLGELGWNQAAGTFAGGSGDITSTSSTTAPFTLSGGTYTATSGQSLFIQTGVSGLDIFNSSGGTFNANTGTVILRGNAVGAPTYNLIFPTSVMAFETLKLQSQGGAGESDRLRLNQTVAGISVVNFEMGRASGSGTVTWEGGFLNRLYSILVTNGSRGGAGRAFSDGNQTYGCTGDGVLPVMYISNWALANYSPTTANCRSSGVWAGLGYFAAPTGTLEFVNGHIRVDVPAGFVHNGGSVKFIEDSFYANVGQSPYIENHSGALMLFNNLSYETTAASAQAFYLSVEGSYPNISVAGDLSLKQGAGAMAFDSSYIAGMIYLQGNLTLDGTTFFNDVNQAMGVTLNGAGVQTITSLNSGRLVGNRLTVDKASGSVSLSGSFIMDTYSAFFRIMNGTVNALGNSITVFKAGWGTQTLQLDAGTTLNMGGGVLTTGTTTNAGTINP